MGMHGSSRVLLSYIRLSYLKASRLTTEPLGKMKIKMAASRRADRGPRAEGRGPTSLGLGPRRLSVDCSQRPSAASREAKVWQKPHIVKNSATVEGAICKWARNYKKSNSNRTGLRPLRTTCTFGFGFGLPSKRKKKQKKEKAKKKEGLGTSHMKALSAPK
jgi:hypothetical protein